MLRTLPNRDPARPAILPSVKSGGIIGSVCVGTAIGATMSNVGAVAPELARDYHLSIASVGLLTTLVFLVHTLLQIPAGRLVDRFGAKRIGLIGVAGIAAINALTLIAPEPWLVFVARTAVGVATGLAFVAGIDLSRQSAGGPIALGMFGASTGLGGGLAVAVVPQVERALQWRAPFASVALLALLALLMLSLAPPTPPARVAGQALPKGAAGVVLRDRRVWRIGLMMASPSGMSQILGTWIVTLLVKAGGWSTREAGLIGSLSLVGGVVARPISGWLMRAHPHSMRWLTIGSILVGSAGVVGLTEAHSLALVIVGSALIGICAGLPFAYGYTMAARLRPDAPAVAAAMVNACGLSLIVACIPLIGLTFSLPGHGRIGFWAAAGVWLAALAFLPPRRDETAPA
jgi:cyanate permease